MASPANPASLAADGGSQTVRAQLLFDAIVLQSQHAPRHLPGPG